MLHALQKTNMWAFYTKQKINLSYPTIKQYLSFQLAKNKLNIAVDDILVLFLHLGKNYMITLLPFWLDCISINTFTFH